MPPPPAAPQPDTPDARAAPRPPRRWLRGFAAVLLGLLAGAFLLGAAVAWLGSASGISWLARQPWFESRSGLRLQGVQGSMWRELRVRRLAWSGPRDSVQAQRVLLRWSPRALWSASPSLHVLALDVDELDVRVAAAAPQGAAAATRPPGSLLAPLPLRLDRLRIGRLRLLRAGHERWLDLGTVQGSLRADARQWHAALQGSGSWGQLRLSAHIATQAPFALHGEVGADVRLQGRQVQLRAKAGGTLARVQLRAQAAALDAHATVQAELLAFDPVWLGPLHVEVDGLDPRRLDPAWPQARLRLLAQLRSAGGDALLGTVDLRNELPGSLDAKRLPLHRLHADVSLRDGALRADALHVTLDGGATLDGSASWHGGGAARLRLQAHALDLHALYGRLLPTRLSGPLQVQAGAATQALQATLMQPGWHVELQARREGTRIELQRAELQAQGATLSARGSVDTSAGQAFEASLRVRGLRPQRFGDWPAASLNLDLRAHGEVASRSAHFALQVLPSRWRAQVFAGRASGWIAPGTVRDLQARLRLGDNSLQAQGGFGAPGQQLRVHLQAGALRQLGAPWQGSAQVDARLHGSLAAPSGRISLRLHELRAPGGVQVAGLSAEVSLQRGLQGPLQGQLQAQDLRVGSQRLHALELQVHGTLLNQVVQLRLDDAPRLRLQARAQGGWQASRGWSGRIDALRNAGPYAFELAAPAQLRLGAHGGVDLQGVVLRSAGGNVELQSLRRDTAGWSSRGSASALDPAYWARAAGIGLHGVHSDLRLDARWDLRTGPEPLAHLRVARSSGDITLPTRPALRLGLSRLQWTVDLAAGSCSTAIDAVGAHLGELQAHAQVALQHDAGGWGVAPDAALQGGASLRLPDLAWVSVLLPQAAHVAGSLQGRFELAGSARAPSLRGSVHGSALALALPRYGLDLRGGSLDLGVDGDTLQLRSLRMHDAAGSGELRASGSLALAGARPSGSIDVQLQQLRALDRPGQQVQLSGQAAVRAGADGLSIDSTLHVDKADIELSGGDAPKLADDVVVEGRGAPAPPSSQAMPVHARIRIDLGQDFHVGGRGVDARLRGALLLRADAGQPLRAEGSVMVRRGSYSAYGQQLSLVEGSSVNFSGPIDNPGLNLSAQRENLPVQVGVHITGTLREPQVALSSTPPMPDGAILSWLVLGQDPSTVGSDQSALLQSAAAALLAGGQGASLTGRVAGALGLDQLSLSGQGGLQNSVLTVGKQISSRLSVSVERGLAATGNLFNVRYEFTRRLSLRLQSGSDNAVDLFYTFRFG